MAKQDLQNRVHSYRAMKAEEHAERVAIAELAAERREQKALEFVHNRFKKAPINQVQASESSLFEPGTGRPRSDSNPLPSTSKPFWAGFVSLAVKLDFLAGVLAARKDHKKKVRRSTIIIQKYWRGYLARQRVRAIIEVSKNKRALGGKASGEGEVTVITGVCSLPQPRLPSRLSTQPSHPPRHGNLSCRRPWATRKRSRASSRACPGASSARRRRSRRQTASCRWVTSWVEG